MNLDTWATRWGKESGSTYKGKNRKGSSGDATSKGNQKGEVWEVDWSRRLWLFDRLIWTVIRYRAEI